MTYKEQLRKWRPEWSEEQLNEIIRSYCPFEFGIDYPPETICRDSSCNECWNHEFGEENNNVSEIKDSGDRTEFETGAVRDMREGKGRCDLMPLEVVANYICECNDKTDDILWAIREFQKSNSTSYLYSALNSFDVRHYGNYCTMFLEVAKHFEEGAKKYGESNWQKGIPVHCYIDSAVRHYLKWLRGDKDEPHDRAFVWNLMCCIWEVNYRKNDATC